MNISLCPICNYPLESPVCPSCGYVYKPVDNNGQEEEEEEKQVN